MDIYWLDGLVQCQCIACCGCAVEEKEKRAGEERVKIFPV